MALINKKPSQAQSSIEANESQSSSLFAFMSKKNVEKTKSSKADAIILKRQYLERENLPENSNPLEFWKVIYVQCSVY